LVLKQIHNHRNDSNHIMSYSDFTEFTYTLHCMHANSECQGAENGCTPSVNRYGFKVE